ncbi:MAG: tetratricopeptide repeat protein [Betaproteobacteria bacterium]
MVESRTDSTPDRFPGAVKLAFVRRLGDDWRALADVLSVPTHTLRRFARQPDPERAVWDWLEDRDRLGVLAGALAEIGRDDLSALFTAGARPLAGGATIDEEAPGRGAVVPNALGVPGAGNAVRTAALPPLVSAPTLDRAVARFSSGGTDTEDCLRDAGEQIERMGNAETVVALLGGLVEDSSALLGPYAATTLELRYRLAGWIWRAGDKDRARRMHAEVWELRERHLGPDHPDTDASFRAAKIHGF